MKTKRFATPREPKKIEFREFSKQSPCLSCPKREKAEQGLCYCPKLKAWQIEQFGEEKALIFEREAVSAIRSAAAKKAWETRRRKEVIHA